MNEAEQKALINRITAEVLHRVAGRLPQDETVSGTAVLVTSHVPSPKSAITQINAIKNGEARFINFGTQFQPFGETVTDANEEGEQAVLEEVATAANVVLLTPRICLLEEIAKGNDKGFVEYLVIRSLLWERNVSVLLDFKPPKFKRNTFYEKVVSIVTELEDMGAIIHTYQSATANGGEAMTLVTENDVMVAYKQKKEEINCAAGAIITPSANDKAKELGIRINY